jgi:hypothetical protein
LRNFGGVTPVIADAHENAAKVEADDTGFRRHADYSG